MSNPRWPRYAAAALGFVWFLQIGGGPSLNPTNTAPIMSGDWMQHWFGWLMFRREEWSFPLGTISGLLYPIGTTIGYTDSNPLVSLLLKPFSGLLPSEFQFIGLWLALCFALQGYAGAALASTVTNDSRAQLFGGYLFVLSPVLVARLSHDTLCAQWLLLSALYLGLRDYADASSARRGAWGATFVTILAATIHPYLVAMCWAVAQATYVRLWRSRLASPGLAAAAATATVGTVAVLGALGYFGGARFGASGFGQYSADLLTLVNPDQFSRALAPFRVSGAQWEGLGFLGLGGLVALPLAIVAYARQRPSLRAGIWAVLVACVLMAVYALSSPITFGGRTVLDAHAFYAPLSSMTAPFRASGRFIWPLHYVVLLCGIWGATRILPASRQSAGAMVLAVVVMLQATDLKMDSLWVRQEFKEVPFSDFTAAVGRYRHLALVPMQVRGICRPYQENYVYRYMLHAYRLRTSYNSGYFSRVDGAAVVAECERLERDVNAGLLDAETIYVVSPSHVPLFQAARAACGRVDGDWVCVSRESDEVFRTYLETGRLIERPPR